MMPRRHCGGDVILFPSDEADPAQIAMRRSVTIHTVRGTDCEVPQELMSNRRPTQIGGVAFCNRRGRSGRRGVANKSSKKSLLRWSNKLASTYL